MFAKRELCSASKETNKEEARKGADGLKLVTEDDSGDDDDDDDVDADVDDDADADVVRKF